mmetsp:Transcript_33905/g.89874  ORF Transcript_33905/g.89874 Transcript_33905/m.89874 type:complete len:311 (-) Transcript_33905:285-1217(-)
MMSMNQSAGFSLSGMRKPFVSKYSLALVDGPRYTVWPPLPSSSTSSKSVKREKRGWWMTMMLVMPSWVIFFSEAQTATELLESRPEVGSSRKSKVGCAASSRPMLTRFRWPPLMPRCSTPPTMLFWMSTTCITLRTSFVMCSILFLCVPTLFRSRAENWICSRTVRCSWTMSSCGTKPMMDLMFPIWAALPLILIVPPMSPYVALPQSTFMKVVLPAPEGPMMAHIRPLSNSPVTPFRTRFPLAPFRVRLRSSNATEMPFAFICMPRNWYFSRFHDGMKFATILSAYVLCSSMAPLASSSLSMLAVHRLL